MNFNTLITFIIVVFIVTGCSTITEKKSGYGCHVDEIENKRNECNARGVEDLSQEAKKGYLSALTKGVERIIENFEPPKADGGKYYGEIVMCLDRSGAIDNIMLTEPSGHQGLDSSMMKAAKKNASNSQCA